MTLPNVFYEKFVSDIQEKSLCYLLEFQNTSAIFHNLCKRVFVKTLKNKILQHCKPLSSLVLDLI